MKKNGIFLIFICPLLLFAIQFATGLTASSENYSVARFETGAASSDSLLSENYSALSISEYEGTTRNAENGVHILNVGFFNNTVYYVTVSIGSYSIYPESAVNGSIIQFSVSALNYQSIWAVLTLPNSTQETISMKNNEYSYYVANQIGTYNITFYANSSRGNLASVIDSFVITSPVTPPTPPSEGGTKIITEECTYIWDCTSWSICSDKVQERKCTNLGNCTGVEGKPLEIRECSDALFDVVMRLNDLEITQNETLNFSVSLTETKGIEKIDVQIKYSIIDSNNTEIFSQIETRAIQGNLTYIKELSEVNLSYGEYILRVDIVYGNLQRAFAEQGFEIVKPETEEEIPEKGDILSLFEELNYAIIILIAFCLLILALIIIVINKLRKRSYAYLIKTSLKEGIEAVRSQEIAKARSIYENLRKIYNPKKDSKKEVYNRIKEFYNNILKNNLR